MNNSRYKYFVNGLFIFTLIAGVIGFYNLARDIGHPFGGYLTHYNGIANRWDISPLTPPWWSNFATEGKVYANVIEELNGQSNTSTMDQRSIYTEAYAHHEPFVSAVISHNGEMINDDENTNVQIPVILFTTAHFLDIKVPDLLNGLGLFLLAIAIYWAKPDETMNQVFASMCCFIILSRWLVPPGLFLHSDWLTKALDLLLAAIISPFMAAFIVHFALLFPSPSRLYLPLLLYALHGINLVIVLIYTISRLGLWYIGPDPLFTELDKWGFYGFLYLAVGGVGFLVIRLIKLSFLTPAITRRERKQAQISLFGLIIGGVYYAPLWGQMLFGVNDDSLVNYYDLRYALLAIPIAVAFVILRYQTFRRGHPALLVVPILGLSGIVAGIGTPLWRSTFESDTLTPFVVALGMTLITGLICGTQVSWQGFFGRLLHWERHNYGSVQRFGQQVIRQTGLKELPLLIAQACVKELELGQAAVYLYHSNNHTFQLAGQAGEWLFPLPTRLVIEQNQLRELERPFRLNASSFPTPSWLTIFTAPAEVATPLFVSDTLVGLLILGKRWDEEIIDDRDLAIIELITQQAALFLLMAIQIDELRRVPRLVDEAQERERTKIGQELHDTIQQFLGRLPFFIEIGRTDAKQRDQILQQCLVDIDDAARTLRQIRNNLTTSQVENGLVYPLQNLAKRFYHHTGIKVQTYFGPEVEDNLLTLNERHALYRVIQQALDNVAEHAEANNVSIKLWEQENKLMFVVEDDGRGFSESEQLQAQAQGSFGLKSMEARIRNLGGEFFIYPTPNNGTRVSGFIPLKN